MKFLTLIISLICLNCAITHPTPNFISKYGFYVYTNGTNLDPEKFDSVIDETIVQLASKKLFTYKEIEKALRSVDRYEIHMRIPEPCVAEDGNRYEAFMWSSVCCRGLWRWNGIRGRIDLLTEKCLGNSSLPHELIHFFDWHINHHEDIFHKDETKFMRGCLIKYPRPEDKNIQDIHGYDRHLCMKNSIENVIAISLINKFCSPNPFSNAVHIYHLWKEKDADNE